MAFDNPTFDMFSHLIFIPALLVIVCIVRFIENYYYWNKLGLKGCRSLFPFVSESIEALTKSADQSQIYRRIKYGKIYGHWFVNKRCIVVADAEVVRQICVRDFDSFANHDDDHLYNDYQVNSSFWLKDDRWKRVRALISPTFTGAKMKRIFRVMNGCANEMVESFRERLKGCNSRLLEVELLEIFALYTINTITTCGYGMRLKRQKELEQTNSHGDSLESMIDVAGKMVEFGKLRLMLTMSLPRFLTRLTGLKLVPNTDVEPLAKRIQRMIEIRRKSPKGKHDDLLQLLIDANLSAKSEIDELDEGENVHSALDLATLKAQEEKWRASIVDKPQMVKSLSDFEVLCEAMLIMSAGMHTTRSSLSTVTYLLAHHPHIQQRLYESLKVIAETDPDGETVFNYDSLTACQYLDAVILESLRRFSPSLIVIRLASNDYHIKKYNVRVPEGMTILLAAHAIHMDSDYWLEPEQFDPDRFMPGRKERIVPGSFLPFGMGARHCVGMRFSLTEMKLGLAKAIMNFKFEPAPGNKYPPVANIAFGAISVRDCRVCVSAR